MPIQKISLGTATLIGQNEVFALPAMSVRLQSSAPLEVGMLPAGPWTPVATTSIAYPSKIVGDGASAYWKLDETSGTQAKTSIGTAHGVISGAVTLNQSGGMLFGPAIGRVDIPSISLPSTFTIECWLKSAPGSVQRFWSNRYGIAGGAGGIFFSINASGQLAGWSNDAGALATTVVVADNTFHHVVIVVRPANVTIYRDGFLGQNVAWGAGRAVNYAQTLGYDDPYANSNQGEQFQGILDDVSVYPLELSATQVASHYAARIDTVAAPFVRCPSGQATVIATREH